MAMAVLIAISELLHWRASRRYLGTVASGHGEIETILVMGYKSRRGGRLHPVQRWRTNIALRSLGDDADSRIIFSGAGEASVMAQYAEQRLIGAKCELVLETEARSTKQNVDNSLSQFLECGPIKIASDPMHAARARHYIRSKYPQLAGRLAPAKDFVALEQWWLKLPTAAYEVSGSFRWAATRFVRRDAVLPGTESVASQ